jgi:hypothetical protein
MTCAKEDIWICIGQMGESVECVIFNSQGDTSREEQVLEENVPVDIVIIRHGSTETTLELLISNPPPQQLPPNPRVIRPN